MLKAIATNIEPNKEVLEVLELLLKEAKSGAIRSIIAAIEYNNKDLGRSYVLEKGANPYQFLGILSVLKDTIIRAHGLTDSVLVDIEDVE